MGKLTGKVAVVTGGARSLGRVYALRLAELGADVGIIDINLHSFAAFEAEKAQMTADTTMDEIRAMGRRSVGVVADVTKSDQVFAAIDQISKELGDVDILVCNAGGGSGALAENTASTLDLDQYEAIMARNLSHTIYAVKAVAPGMIKKHYGKIVTVCSQGGIEVGHLGSYLHYDVAKAGIKFYTLCASAELGKYGINVNCLSPGYVGTARIAPQLEKAGTDNITNHISLGRIGTPEDCAKALEFLVTDLSDFVTGITLEVTGGSTRKL